VGPKKKKTVSPGDQGVRRPTPSPGYDGARGSIHVIHASTLSRVVLGLGRPISTLRRNDCATACASDVDVLLNTGGSMWWKAAILEPESFCFGTAPMVALGATYLRICL